ncbi:hypothetical protein TWF102_000893 [Orbilia oligospora]|uniref:Uncharacterized protein n=1 Tax=Orbilia oligospora TaxID=2813651 RepID=A0A7C8NCD5_ORBOL|nr:hypothetical protein TWF102_000893 [Orbilia oligospora]KAF3118157.1 hypothetical protein TWF103_000185 [Orbilia oligospora]KAF3119055.1 hypothetical protein TWF703_003787 [Orbilia oligospora]
MLIGTTIMPPIRPRALVHERMRRLNLQIKDLQDHVIQMSTSAYDVETAVQYELGEQLHPDNIKHIRESAKRVADTLLSNQALGIDCGKTLGQYASVGCAEGSCMACNGPARVWYQIDRIRDKVESVYDMIHEEAKVSRESSVPGVVTEMLLEVKSVRKGLGSPTLDATYRKRVWDMHLKSIYRELKDLFTIRQKRQQGNLLSFISNRGLFTPVPGSGLSGGTVRVGKEDVQSAKEESQSKDDVVFHLLQR